MIWLIIVNGPEPKQGTRDWREMFVDKELAASVFRHLPVADDEFAQLVAIHPDGWFEPRLNRWGKTAATIAISKIPQANA